MQIERMATLAKEVIAQARQARFANEFEAVKTAAQDFDRRIAEWSQERLDEAKADGRETLLADEARKVDKLRALRGDVATEVAMMRVAEAQSTANGAKLAGTPTLPTVAAFHNNHDFLFGEKVKRTALEVRALSSTTDAYGGYFLTTDQNAFYAPLLVARSVALESGIAFIPTGDAEIKMPIEQTDPVASWTAEGGTITESTPTWGLGSIIPRKLAALVAVPNELLHQGETSPLIARVVERRMTRAMSGGLDLAIYEGNGQGQPLGLKNTAGINEVSMGTNGATFANLDPFADAIGAVLEDNADASAIVMHPRDWKNLIKVKEQTSGNNKPLLQESAGSGGQAVRRTIYGVPVFLTSRLSTTETQGSSGAVCSSAYVYDAQWIAFAQRMALQLARDSSRLFNQDKSEIRSILRGNLVVMEPTAICRILGIKAS